MGPPCHPGPWMYMAIRSLQNKRNPPFQQKKQEESPKNLIQIATKRVARKLVTAQEVKSETDVDAIALMQRRWVRARATWRPTAASSGAAPSATSSRGSTPATTSSASATPSARSSRSTRQEVPVHRHLPRHPIRSPPCNWLCSLQLISHRTAFFSRNKLAVSAFQSAYKSNRTDLSSTQVAEPTNFYPPPR